MNNDKSFTDTVHHYFYMETQCGRKPHKNFSYMSLRSTFIGRTNLLCSPTPTPYILMLKPEGSSISQILWLQPEGGYNPLVLRLQPPILAPSNHPEI
jgi:hypothetical protein